MKEPWTREDQERAEEERADTWRNISDAQIRAKLHTLNNHPMRMTLGHMLAVAINRHAPHKLGLLPPEFLTDITIAELHDADA